MAKVRFIGNEPHKVEAPLHRTVNPDDLVEIDDELLTAYAWPASQWDVVADSGTSTAKEGKR